MAVFCSTSSLAAATASALLSFSALSSAASVEIWPRNSAIVCLSAPFFSLILDAASAACSATAVAFAAGVDLV